MAGSDGSESVIQWHLTPSYRHSLILFRCEHCLGREKIQVEVEFIFLSNGPPLSLRVLCIYNLRLSILPVLLLLIICDLLMFKLYVQCML